MPQLAPGAQFTIEFPDMPPTMSNVFVPSDKTKPSMTVFLPVNYNATTQHPLLVFLEGGSGGYGNEVRIARKLAQDKDFICVNMPLFKNTTGGTGPPRMQLDDADYRYMWSFQKKMLLKLGQLMPNIDPSHSALGGFSNGAHATTGLVAQSDGEVLKMFAAFFCVEGGVRMRRYELLRGRQMLLLFGNASVSHQPIDQREQEARAAGVEIVVHWMAEPIGHAFPESEYPFVTDWLRNVVLKQ